MAGADYATRRNRRTRTDIEEDITGTTKNPLRKGGTRKVKTKTRCNCQGQPSRKIRRVAAHYNELNKDYVEKKQIMWEVQNVRDGEYRRGTECKRCRI
jgi:hypothetical protein